jgi:hypothetical protein
MAGRNSTYLLHAAMVKAKSLGSPAADPRHVLLILLDSRPDDPARRALEAAGISADKVRAVTGRSRRRGVVSNPALIRVDGFAQAWRPAGETEQRQRQIISWRCAGIPSSGWMIGILGASSCGHSRPKEQRSPQVRYRAGIGRGSRSGSRSLVRISTLRSLCSRSGIPWAAIRGGGSTTGHRAQRSRSPRMASIWSRSSPTYSPLDNAAAEPTTGTGGEGRGGERDISK